MRAALPGFDGAGVTIALLDTGVDTAHPYIREQLLEGVDIVDPGKGAIAHQHPTIPGRPERHGTAMAGILVGSDGPAGLDRCGARRVRDARQGGRLATRRCG